MPITSTSPSSQACQKSGSFAPPALPSLNARTTLSDSRLDRRLKTTLRPQPSPRTGLPQLPGTPFRRAVPTTPADRAGALVDFFPARAAFPKWQEGRHPHCHFRGLLRLHACYGPSDRSAAQGDLCHEASALPVTRQSRSSATGPIDNSPCGTLLHWCFAPSGRTAKSGRLHCSILVRSRPTKDRRAAPWRPANRAYRIPWQTNRRPVRAAPNPNYS